MRDIIYVVFKGKSSAGVSSKLVVYEGKDILPGIAAGQAEPYAGLFGLPGLQSSEAAA